MSPSLDRLSSLLEGEDSLRVSDRRRASRVPALLAAGLLVCMAAAQDRTPNPPPGGPADRPPGRNGPPGGPGGRGPGGMGPMQAELKVVKKFDRDGDKRLTADERKAAREFVVQERASQGGPGRRGPRGAEANQPPPGPGPRLKPADVGSFPGKSLYDPSTLRTLFLEFENPDWEKELSDFYNTDVEVPARLTVDGKAYPDVGVHFRGASSFFTVGAGRKRSLNVSLDYAHENQQLDGYRTLNLLNSHTDPTFLRTMLYLEVARDYLPASKANYVRVVLNGESWGVYVNVQQFNKDFVRDNFGTTQGARWKVPGSPRGRGSLEYLGDDPAAYKPIYDLRTQDDPASWASLIRLCKLLNQTPPDQLEQTLRPILDIDGALRFLALENALINSDGYWIRTSDYNLYLDPQGRFHLVPHDTNETFRSPEGPGMPGGAATDGIKLDPLTGADDPSKPLLKQLLAVPALRERYLACIRDIAEKWLVWEKIGPLAERYQALIAADVRTDTHKLYGEEAFRRGVTQDVEEEGFRGPRLSISLRSFVQQRHDFLLAHPAVQAANKNSTAK